MTTLLILFVVAFVVTLIFAIKGNDWFDGCYWDVSCGVSAFLSGVGALIVGLVWILSPLQYKSEIKQFEAFQQTLSNARELPLSEFERAAIQTKIADWNEWLADVKYKDTWMINLVPDEVNKLEPVK
jgi:uncharacterized integral membrane protein